MLNSIIPKTFFLWDNVEEYVRRRQATGENIIRRMRRSCRITKAEYLIFIAFPQQQNLRQPASIVTLHVMPVCGVCLTLHR